jgi:hypothetical protein
MWVPEPFFGVWKRQLCQRSLIFYGAWWGVTAAAGCCRQRVVVGQGGERRHHQAMDSNNIPHAIICSSDELNAAVEHINSISASLPVAVIGLDCEWRPIKNSRIALLQLSIPDVTYLIRILLCAELSALKSILENPNLLKCGVGITQDVFRLQRDFGLVVNHFVELNQVAIRAGFLSSSENQVSLQKLARLICGIELQKNTVRTSDWEATQLSAAQIQYAAADAYVSRKIFLDCLTQFQLSQYPNLSEDSPELNQSSSRLSELVRDLVVSSSSARPSALNEIPPTIRAPKSQLDIASERDCIRKIAKQQVPAFI